MARSRYGQQDQVDNAHFGTFSKRIEGGGYLDTNLLDGIRSFEYITNKGERLDVIANRFIHESKYWWVLALINKIDYAFGLPAGTKLRIPYDVKEVFKKIYL
jgi:hypothetical protein